MPHRYFIKVALLHRIHVNASNFRSGMLETILFANIRFHDTVSRGRVLNRFGKDFEGLVTIQFSVFVEIQPCLSCRD